MNPLKFSEETQGVGTAVKLTTKPSNKEIAYINIDNGKPITWAEVLGYEMSGRILDMVINGGLNPDIEHKIGFAICEDWVECIGNNRELFKETIHNELVKHFHFISQIGKIVFTNDNLLIIHGLLIVPTPFEKDFDGIIELDMNSSQNKGNNKYKLL